jgi:hypothetical protein
MVMGAKLPSTFPCPHCAAVYPFKAVLIGRVVRCRTCHQAFLVHENGTATKAAEAAPNAATAEPVHADPPAANPETRAADDRSTHGAKSPETSAPADKKAAATRRHHAQLTTQQEEMRHQMSAALAGAAGRAVQGTAAEGPIPVGPPAVAETTAGTAATRPQAPEPAMAAKSPRERRPAEAVFTHDGARARRERQRTQIIIAGAVMALVLAVALWRCWPDAQRDALRAFAQPPGDGMVVLRDFADTVRHRGWVVAEQLPLVAIGRVDIAPARTITVAGWSEDVGLIKGLVFDDAHQLWTAPGHARDISSLWRGKATRAANLAALKNRMQPMLPREDLVSDLEHRGLPPGDADLIAGLLAGTDPLTGTPLAAALDADPPQALVLAGFSGQGQCVRLGRGVEVAPVSYAGTLLRVTGGRWPQTWRVLEIHEDAGGGKR